MKKTYTIVITETKEGIRIRRINRGFDGFQLLGFLSMIKTEIIANIEGLTKPKLVFNEATVHIKKP